MTKSPQKKLILVLVGPTGSGKSEVAVCLARRLTGEIVNCDSMQLYKGMDIGTAKPGKRDRKQIRHHLLDLITPSQRMNAARFARLAREAIGEIVKREKIPILVGGSGLYIRSTLDGIFPGVGADAVLRKKLYARLRKEGSQALHARLKRVDPQAAQKIHPHDGRRIVRALEVHQKTGKPISLLQKTRQGIGKEYRSLWFGLLPDREELYRRIEGRVEQMFQRGLVGEVKRLSRKKMGLTSRKALGYSEILAYLKGETSLERAIELVKRNSRRYAKRQLSWFRREKQIRWDPISLSQAPDQIAKRILSRVKRYV